MQSAVLASVAALALCSAAAAPALATEVTYTYAGTVVSGTDGNNFFGYGIGADLAGKSYTVVETFFNAVPSGPIVDPNTFSYVTFFPTEIEEKITIGNATSDGAVFGSGVITLTKDVGFTTSVGAGTNDALSFQVQTTGIVSTALTSFSADASNSTIAGTYHNVFAPFGSPSTSTDITFGNGTASLSAVPLPASLPLFGAALLGLGAVGYGLKRSGKTARPA